jgi:Fur family transcriptional regulator, peroxide stress response regulator
VGAATVRSVFVMTIIPKKRRRPAVDPAPAAALRKVGLRLTGPRRVVLEVVRGTESHPTAEAVHRLVRRRLPRVSLGTVYRNLRLLVSEGLVQELPGPHARFDGNTSEHHHFTCLGCGRIVDVDGPLTEPHSRVLCRRVAAQGGFSVTHHRIEFYGRCAGCQTASSRPRRRRHPENRAATHPSHREEESAWQGRVSRARRVTTT